MRELGVVHVAEKQQGVADNVELQDSIRLSSRLQATLKMLHGLSEAKEPTPASAARGLEVLDEVDVLQSEKAKLQQQLQNYQKERAALEPWGDFEPESLSKLHDAGFTVNFYSCSEGSYDETWEEIYNAMIINRVSSRIYFITITKNVVEVDLDAEQIKLKVFCVKPGECEFLRLFYFITRSIHRGRPLPRGLPVKRCRSGRAFLRARAGYVPSL